MPFLTNALVSVRFSYRLRARRAVQFLSLSTLLCAVVSLGAAQTPPPASFTSAQLFDTGFAGLGHGGTPEAIAVGDFNGDGKKDLVVVGANCTCPAVVTTFLGNGGGSFTLQQQTTLTVRNGNDGINAHNPNSIATGDFNHDGHLDFAIYVNGDGSGTNYVDVYLGDGTGDFSYSNSYSVGAAGTAGLVDGVVAADVNGDHKLDLLAINAGDNTVTVLLGKGDGTFQNGVLYPACNVTGCSPLSITTGDFNKDGHLDIAVADYSGAIDILLNNGNGTFQAPAYYPAPACSSGASPCYGGNPDNESGIASDDLNGDGDLDLVITANSGVWVYLGNGDGTFQTPVNYSFLYGDTIVIADVNRDKKLDLIVPDFYNNAVWILLGNGDGTFKPALAYATDWFPQSLVVADFNGDGLLDLAMGSDAGPYITLAFGNGDGTFRASANYNIGDWIGQASADFNHDGNLDVMAFSSHQVAVMLGSSHGILAAPIITTPPQPIAWAAAGDVNGDGKADLVISAQTNTTDGQMAVLLGNGDGTFQPQVLYSTGDTTYPGLVTLADVNKDGKLDIIETNGDNTVSVLLNTGNGTFGSPIVFSGGNGGFVVTGDFNHDGKIDLAINDWTNNSIDIFLGNGDGTFRPLVAYPVVNHPEWVVVADFNKDKKLDLATGGYSVTGGLFNNAGIAILLGNGDGTFGSATYYSTYPASFPNDDPDAGVVADVNLDGIPDLVVSFADTHLGSGACCNTPANIGLGIFLGNGDGTFSLENPFGGGVTGGSFLVGTGSLGGGLVAGDFNSDGAMDAAVLNAHNFGGGAGQAYTTVLLNHTAPVSVSPLKIKFPSRKVGATGPGSTVLITNDQATMLSITSVTMGGTDPGDFPYKSACKSTLPPGADCTISVTFKPSATGSRTAQLMISDGAGTQTVSISGTGK
jgi:hypothetical protein